MPFKIAVVQPMAHPPQEIKKNVADAIRYVENAASQEADIVTFPETYPGPWRMPVDNDLIETMGEVAKRCGVYVQYGTLEPIDDQKREAYNLLMLAYPDGRPQGKYRRTHPPGPWIYTGGKYWDFMYVAGNEFPTFQTEHGTLGLAMCSEVYVPEVSRALALRGAEIILLPAGIDKQKLWATWRNLIWARSIENLAVVVTTQNLFNSNQRGLAMVATPEEIIFESTAPGMFLIDIDLTRIRELRASPDEPSSSLTFGAKSGVLSQWQRPEMYGRFFPQE
jgi:predicted amidohydrolase